MASKIDLSRVYFEQEIQPNIYCNQADSLQQTLENVIIVVLINIYISSLVEMID